LKIKAREILRSTWRGLTDVPGWPDAPFAMRFRRSLPIVLPVIATALLLGWQIGYAQPRLRAAHQAHRPLLKLEREVAALNHAFSEQQVEELATREATLMRSLPQNVSDIREVLQSIEREAQRLAWDVSFSTPTLPESPASPEALIADVPVRMKLKPASGNAEPFNSLLALLERVSALSRRIGLMRFAISADDGRWQAVEVGLRFTVPISHAQAAQ
jgi:hypothetical protein